MGFSLTDEDHMVVRHKDIKKEITTDHYLAPAISKLAINVQTVEEREPTLDQEARELRREIIALHPNMG